MATYNAHLDEFLESVGITDTARHHPDRTSECPDSTASCDDATESFGASDAAEEFTPGAALRERRILWMVIQVPQTNGEYCGPATAYSIAKYWEFDESFFHDYLSQAALGAKCTTGQYGCGDIAGKYLMTDYFHGTNWNYHICLPLCGYLHYPMAQGINRWYNGGENSLYLAVGVPHTTITYTMFKNALAQNMDAGWPMAANVDENTEGNPYRLNGHPTNRPISHWVAVRGYSNWGDNTHYVDSAYHGTGLGEGFTITQGNQRILTNEMVQMVKWKGYIW